MPSIRTVVLGALFVLAPLSRAYAQPLEAKQVPADAKWVIHLDMDGVMASPLGDAINKKIEQTPRARAAIKEVEIITGLTYPQGLHDVTLYGRDFTPDAGVLLVHSNTDHAKIMNALQLNPAYASSTYGSYAVYTWADKGKTMHGSFHGDSLIVMSQSEKNVQAALDLLDGKGAGLKADSSLLTGAGKSTLFYIAAEGLTALQQEHHTKSPLLAQVDTGWISCDLQDKNMVLHGAIVVATAEAARQMCTSLEGIKAMVTLAGNAEDADPKARVAADAIKNVTAKAQNKTLTVDWPISLDLVRAELENIGKHAATRTATAPASVGE
jgi:hypothetical protein